MIIHELVASIEPEINAVRKQIHENPELGLREYQTSALVESELREKTHVDRIEHIGETGLLVELKGTRTGEAHCIALRGDMDALPVKTKPRTASWPQAAYTRPAARCCAWAPTRLICPACRETNSSPARS